MRAPAGIALLSDGTWDCGSSGGEWSPGGCGCGSNGSCECGGPRGCGGSCGKAVQCGDGLGSIPHLPDYDGVLLAYPHQRAAESLPPSATQDDSTFSLGSHLGQLLTASGEYRATARFEPPKILHARRSAAPVGVMDLVPVHISLVMGGASNQQTFAVTASADLDENVSGGIVLYVARRDWGYVSPFAIASHSARTGDKILKDETSAGLLQESMMPLEMGENGSEWTSQCGANALAVPWWVWWLIDKALFYGSYCGPMSVLPGPAPVDGLDKCCQDHDNCYVAAGVDWWNALPGCGTPASAACDAILAACAKAFDCTTLPLLQQPHCFTYRAEVMVYFG
jgi:hypothetical protein